ncbi:S-protein homolog 1-like [Cucumis sativus]|uniref:S-protein homolog 1-like n=1 Tax=Cucumis sativus TaxID=3659 RepID=UPI0002B443E5|nr:S-protein homolog 1-like [Cucumis sativus]
MVQKKMMIRNGVVLWLATAALVGAQVPSWSVSIVNGLSHLDLNVHCQSKNDDLGNHHLVKRGDIYKWNFKENFWGTTLFWCKLEKSDAYVSFETFWPESWSNTWLRDRCGPEGTCIWVAKDGGIYLKNNPANRDEFVHKWWIGK